MTWLNLSVTLTEGGKRLEALLQQLKARQQERERLRAEVLPAVREELTPREGSDPRDRRRRIEPIGTRTRPQDDLILYTYQARFASVSYALVSIDPPINTCELAGGVLHETLAPHGDWRSLAQWHVNPRTGRVASGAKATAHKVTIETDLPLPRIFCNNGDNTFTEYSPPSAVSQVTVRAVFEDGSSPSDGLTAGTLNQTSRWTSWSIIFRLVRLTWNGSGFDTVVVADGDVFPELPSEWI